MRFSLPTVVIIPILLLFYPCLGDDEEELMSFRGLPMDEDQPWIAGGAYTFTAEYTDYRKASKMKHSSIRLDRLQVELNLEEMSNDRFLANATYLPLQRQGNELVPIVTEKKKHLPEAFNVTITIPDKVPSGKYSMSWLGKSSILGRESEKVETPEEFYIRAKDPVLVEYLNYIKQVAESEEL